MAHVRKPKYTRPVPSDAKLSEASGVRFATWTARTGEKLTGVLIGDGSRCRVEGSVYHVFYTDHKGRPQREPAFANLRLSERKMHDILDRIDGMKAGSLSESANPKRAGSMDDLLDGWHKGLLDKGDSQGHADESKARVSATLMQAAIVRPADLARDVIAAAIAHFREHGVPRIEKRAPRSVPLSAQTQRHYIASCKVFSGWLADEGYLPADPLARLRGPKVEGYETFVRRALTIPELKRLIAATAKRKSSCVLDGPARSMIYLTAFYTGFRLNELAGLNPEMFNLDSKPPNLFLPARFTLKKKRDARQYIPAIVAKKLKAHLKGKPVGQPVWGWAQSFFADKKAAKVLRNDLVGAKIPAETTDGVIDFHALRTSYITALGEAGVPLQHVQRMARHSDPRLTMKHYLRVKDADLARSASKLKAPS